MKKTILTLTILILAITVQAQHKPIKFKPVPNTNTGGTTYVSVNLKLYKFLKKVK